MGHPLNLPNEGTQVRKDLILSLERFRKEDRVLVRRRALESAAIEGDSPVFQKPDRIQGVPE